MTSPPRTELGERLAAIRRDQGLTQVELAGLARTSQSAISQIEAGTRNPSYEMMLKLAGALGVSPCYLLESEAVDMTPGEERLFRKVRALAPEACGELEEFADFLRTKYPRRAGSER